MSEINHSLLLDGLNNSVAEHEMVYDSEGNAIDYKYKYVNKHFCISLNVSSVDILGKNVFDIFPETEIFWLKKYSEIVDTGISEDFLHYAQQFDRYFNVFAYKSRDNHFVASFKDVTDIVKSTMDMPTDSELLRTFRVSSKAAFFEFDIIKEKFNSSKNLTEILGFEDLTFKTYLKGFYANIHQDDIKSVAFYVNQLVMGDVEEITLETRFFNHQKNAYVWLTFFAYIAAKKRGTPTNIKGIVRDINEAKKIEFDTEESNRLFNQTRKIANMTTFLYYPDIRTFDESLELCNFLGVEKLENIEDFRKIVHPEDIDLYDSSTNEILKNSSGGSTYRIIKNGKIGYIKSALFSIKNDNGATAKVSGILKDITEEEETRQTLENSRKSFSQIFQSSPAGIFILNKEFEIVLRNPRFIEYTKTKTITIKEFLSEQYESTKEYLKHNDKIEDLEITYLVDDEIKYLLVSISTMIEGLTNKYQGTVTDVTDTVRDAEQIKFLATRDILTQIYNRNYFEKYTEKLLESRVGIIMCDIDGLKLINDAFGHLEGDKLLIQFAAHLNNSFKDDMVARLGGDEFVILTNSNSLDELEEYESKIQEYVGDLYMFGINIGVSIGYSLKGEKDDFYKSFIKAENIMYRRKLTERSSRKSNALTTIMQTLHEKTHETKEHCDRVGNYAAGLLGMIGRKRKYEIEEIKLVSSVHDIGKIAVSDAILHKAAKLTEDEYEQIKYHSESGYKIVTNIINNDDIAIAVLYHHEKWDGTGYPHNLEGEQIPLYARVVSIADAYDTMISGRNYQKRITKELAKAELLRCAGSQFDPSLIKLFIKYLEKK